MTHKIARHITIAKAVAVFGFVLGCATLNTGARYCGYLPHATGTTRADKTVAMIVFSIGTYAVNSIILGWVRDPLPMMRTSVDVPRCQTHAPKPRKKRPAVWPSSTALPSRHSSGPLTCGPRPTSRGTSWPCRPAPHSALPRLQVPGECASGSRARTRRYEAPRTRQLSFMRTREETSGSDIFSGHLGVLRWQPSRLSHHFKHRTQASLEFIDAEKL